MNIDRLKQLADFLALPAIDEDGNVIPREYKNKLHHHEWDYSCVRFFDRRGSELGELPTLFPEYWERKGHLSVVRIGMESLPFWDTVNEFFGITPEQSELLFLYGDGNKKQCARVGRLHTSASRVDVANQIARLIGITEYPLVEL